MENLQIKIKNFFFTDMNIGYNKEKMKENKKMYHNCNAIQGSI